MMFCFTFNKCATSVLELLRLKLCAAQHHVVSCLQHKSIQFFGVAFAGVIPSGNTIGEGRCPILLV